MKIKTADLTGAALDWAVAKCEGFESFEFWHTGAVTTRQENGLTITHKYSTDWAQGGPIIEREGITLRSCIDGAAWDAELAYEETILASGPTPLIAAMRCYVASKLGAEVEVPEELCASAI